MSCRIALRGTSGSGKSTIGAELAWRLGVPHIELDALHHGPNWQEPSAEAFRARVSRAMAAAPNGWVIDGNYESKLGTLVTDSADTVVWLDLPLPMLLRRVWLRTVHRIRNRVDLWNGNRETWGTALWSPPHSLMLSTIRSYYRHRHEWPRTLGAHPDVVRLRSPAEVRRWLERQHGPRASPV